MKKPFKNNSIYFDLVGWNYFSDCTKSEQFLMEQIMMGPGARFGQSNFHKSPYPSGLSLLMAGWERQ